MGYTDKYERDAYGISRFGCGMIMIMVDFLIGK